MFDKLTFKKYYKQCLKLCEHSANMLMQNEFNTSLQNCQFQLATRASLTSKLSHVDDEIDTVDGAILPPKCPTDFKNVPSIETLNSEMPRKELQKDRGRKAFKIFLNRLRLKRYGSATISKPDPVFRVAYLGNVVTGWAKGEFDF